MKKRPWLPIAVVLLVLLGVTVVISSVLRSRLSEAERALDPFMVEELPGLLGPGTELPAEPCRNAEQIADELRAFHQAVDTDRATAIDNGEPPAEMSTTDATFDSFLLESAVSRVGYGNHALLLRARSSDGGWCLDEVVFTSET